MEYRHGTCSSCGAHYRVPATFKADKAKCKKCEGVVEIGPVQSEAREDKPAAAPAKKPGAAKAPARRPAPRAAKPTARPAPKAAPKTAKAAPRSGTPKAGGARETDSVRAAAEAAAERVRSAGARPAKKKVGVQKTKAGASRSGAKRTRREPKAKKKNPAMLIGGLVVVVLIAFGGFFLLKGGEGSETQAAETEVASANTTPVDESVALEAEAVPEEEAPPEEEAIPEEEPAEEVRAPRDEKDPDLVDLAGLADYEKLPETSDDDWQQYLEWVTVFVDPDSGAAGNRAKGKLLEVGRPTFPALLNEFKKVNFATDEGYRTGDLIQRLLKDICRGNNFDWRYTTEPKDVYFNKRVVEMWYKSWGQVVENPRAWIKLGKLTAEEEAEYMAQYETPADIGVTDDLDDF